MLIDLLNFQHEDMCVCESPIPLTLSLNAYNILLRFSVTLKKLAPTLNLE